MFIRKKKAWIFQNSPYFWLWLTSFKLYGLLNNNPELPHQSEFSQKGRIWPRLIKGGRKEANFCWKVRNYNTSIILPIQLSLFSQFSLMNNIPQNKQHNCLSQESLNAILHITSGVESSSSLINIKQDKVFCALEGRLLFLKGRKKYEFSQISKLIKDRLF